MTPALITQARDRATEIALRLGEIEHYKAAASALSAEILSGAEQLPKAVPLRGASDTLYQVRRWDIGAHTKRSISTKSLKSRFPAAYREAVKLIAPAHPYHLRLDGPTRIPHEWALLKTQGELRAKQRLTESFGELAWNTVTRLQVLHELRELGDLATITNDGEKQELIEFVTDNDLPLVIDGNGNGKIRLRENPPSVKIDYDLLERKYPTAATLINRSATAASSRIVLTKIEPDPDEDDETEDEYVRRVFGDI